MEKWWQFSEIVYTESDGGYLSMNILKFWNVRSSMLKRCQIKDIIILQKYGMIWQ